MGSSRSSSVRSHDESQSLSMADVVYRTIMFITENRSRGDTDAVHRLVDDLENNLAPFHDPQYDDDLNAIANLPKRKANNSAARAAIATAHMTTVYNLKHRALVRLADRLGWFGHRNSPRVTETEQVSGGYQYEQVV